MPLLLGGNNKLDYQEHLSGSVLNKTDLDFTNLDGIFKTEHGAI